VTAPAPPGPSQTASAMSKADRVELTAVPTTSAPRCDCHSLTHLEKRRSSRQRSDHTCSRRTARRSARSCYRKWPPIFASAATITIGSLSAPAPRSTRWTWAHAASSCNDDRLGLDRAGTQRSLCSFPSPARPDDLDSWVTPLRAPCAARSSMTELINPCRSEEGKTPKR
jgi:hypothetical protein